MRAPTCLSTGSGDFLLATAGCRRLRISKRVTHLTRRRLVFFRQKFALTSQAAKRLHNHSRCSPIPASPDYLRLPPDSDRRADMLPSPEGAKSRHQRIYSITSSAPTWSAGCKRLKSFRHQMRAVKRLHSTRLSSRTLKSGTVSQCREFRARAESIRSGIRISRIKMGHALLPHVDKGTRGDVIHGFPDAFDCRKCIAPDRTFAPLFALFLALVRRAH